MTSKIDDLKALMAKATPGPWAIDPDDRPDMEWNNQIVCAADPNTTICFMSHDGTKENVRGFANVGLIVAAVNTLPDLLAAVEALKAVIQDLKLRATIDDRHNTILNISNGVLEQARAALAKLGER